MPLSRSSTKRSDLKHLVAFAMITAAMMAVRPTVSYRALDLGAGAGMIGLIGGAYAGLSLVTAIPLGSRIDRNGERFFFLLGAAFVAVASVANSLVSAAFMLIATQSLLGFGHMCAGLSIQSLSSKGPNQQRVSRFARMAVAGSAGQFVGPLAAGWILGRPSGPAGMSTQSAVFIAAAVTCAFAAIISWNAPTWHDATDVRQSDGPKGGAFGIIRIEGMKAALVTSIAVLTATDILIAYLPVLGEDNGISPSFIGLLISVIAAAALASRVVAGRMVARFGRRRTLAANVIMAGVALLGIAFFPIRPILVVLATIVGFGLGFGQPITAAWVSEKAPEGRAGAALALRLTGNRLGQLLLPAALGSLAGVVGTPLVFVGAASGLIGSAAWLRRVPDEH